MKVLWAEDVEPGDAIETSQGVVIVDSIWGDGDEFTFFGNIADGSKRVELTYQYDDHIKVVS